MFQLKIGQPRIVWAPPADEGAPPTAPVVPPVAPGTPPPAAHPVTAPWTGDAVWKLGEGDAAQPWYATIPEEAARQHVEAKGYKNPAELALANYNLTKLQRNDPTVVGLPGKDATPDEWNAYYTKVGRPETPDGYEFTFKPEVKPDEAMMKWGKTVFHEAGLTPRQAQIVADKWNEFAADTTGTANQAATQQNDTELAQLTTKWGADLEVNKAAGQRVVQALGLSADLVARVEDKIGSAAIVELLATIGRKSDEGALINGDGQRDPNNPDTMSKEAAQARINQLSADADFQKKYMDAKHPSHQEAVNEMMRLYARV